MRARPSAALPPAAVVLRGRCGARSSRPASPIDGPSADVLDVGGVAWPRTAPAASSTASASTGARTSSPRASPTAVWRAPQRIDAGQRFDSSWPRDRRRRAAGGWSSIWVQEFGAGADRLFSASLDPARRRFQAPIPVDLNVGEATATAPVARDEPRGAAYLAYRVLAASRAARAPPGTARATSASRATTARCGRRSACPLDRNAGGAGRDADARQLAAVGDRRDRRRRRRLAGARRRASIDRVWARRLFGGNRASADRLAADLGRHAAARAPPTSSRSRGRLRQARSCFRQRPRAGGALRGTRVMLTRCPSRSRPRRRAFGDAADRRRRRRPAGGGARARGGRVGAGLGRLLVASRRRPAQRCWSPATTAPCGEPERARRRRRRGRRRPARGRSAPSGRRRGGLEGRPRRARRRRRPRAARRRRPAVARVARRPAARPAELASAARASATRSSRWRRATRARRQIAAAGGRRAAGPVRRPDAARLRAARPRAADVGRPAERRSAGVRYTRRGRRRDGRRGPDAAPRCDLRRAQLRRRRAGGPGRGRRRRPGDLEHPACRAQDRPPAPRVRVAALRNRRVAVRRRPTGAAAPDLRRRRARGPRSRGATASAPAAAARRAPLQARRPFRVRIVVRDLAGNAARVRRRVRSMRRAARDRGGRAGAARRGARRGLRRATARAIARCRSSGSSRATTRSPSAISPTAATCVFETRAATSSPTTIPTRPARYRGRHLPARHRRRRAQLVAAATCAQESDDALLVALGARNPSVCDDGRYVAFSTAERLVPADVNDDDRRLRARHDARAARPARTRSSRRATAATRRAATRAATPDRAGPQPRHRRLPGAAISDDGRRVVFRTRRGSRPTCRRRRSPDAPPAQVFVRDGGAERTDARHDRAPGSDPPAPRRAGRRRGGDLRRRLDRRVDGPHRRPSSPRFLTARPRPARVLLPLAADRRRAGGADAADHRRADLDDPAATASYVPIATASGPCYGPLTDPERRWRRSSARRPR